MPIKVLLVDDSAVIRGLMSKAISADSEIEVIGSAANGQMAVDMAKNLQPDIILLDIEMPIMDGITALPLLLKNSPNSKIIMISSLTLSNAAISLQALELGATDYIPKPSARIGDGVEIFYREVIEKIKILGTKKAGRVPFSPPPAFINKPNSVQFRPAVEEKKPEITPSIIPAKPIPTPQISTIKPTITPVQAPLTPPTLPTVVANTNNPLNVTGVKALAIASSTGGPQALMTLFDSLKGRLLNIPIFITQHMPATFTTILAEHLTKSSGRPCYEAKGGEVPVAGSVYLAAGDFHMIAEKDSSGQVVLRINQEPQENFCRPAADPMLRSLSAIYGNKLVVVVLTGMGQDGMKGCQTVVANGGSVIAQDEASCVVYGMPKAVVENKLCKAILPLAEIGRYLITQIEGR